MEKTEYKKLAEMTANGDTKAFARLYELVYREMYYTAFYSLADDTDACAAVISTARDAFAAIGKLHSEEQFRLFMMRSLCGRIKAKFKEYAAQGIQVDYDEDQRRPNEDGVDIKQEFNRLPDIERMITSLYIIGRFTGDEIAQFTGLSASTVMKKLERVLAEFALD